MTPLERAARAVADVWWDSHHFGNDVPRYNWDRLHPAQRKASFATARAVLMAVRDSAATEREKQMMTKYDYRRMGFNDTGKAPLLRTRIVSLVAKVLGLQIKIGAACYGASYETAINTRDQARLPAKRDAMQAASSQ